jgi:ribosomal protein S18 acetylase RimI-like enzyme
MGIYEDLRSRLRFNNTQYVCLVAVKLNDSSEQSAAKVSSQSILETIVGTVEIGPRSTPIWLPSNRQSLYLSNLAVKPEARRQGVALQLLKNAEQIALNWGHKDIYLHVLENNHGARRLYWKAGFRLKQAEFGIVNWLLGQPRQLYLHKQIS